MIKSTKGSKERMDVMKTIGDLIESIKELDEKQCVLIGVVGALLLSIPLVIYILHDAGVF